MEQVNNYIQLAKAKYQQIIDTFSTSKILKDISPVDIKSSKKIFIFSHTSFSFYMKLYILFAHALSKRNIPSYFLFKFNLQGSHLTNLVINEQKISNSLYVEKTPKISICNGKNRKLNFKWIVELEHERIEAYGVNLFPCVLNTLKALYKRYNIDFKDKHVISTYQKMIYSCDLLLQYFLLLKEYANKQNVKIRIVGLESDYIPNGIFRMLCNYLSKNGDIEYLDVSRGYPHYFSHHFRETDILSMNFTKTRANNKISLLSEELLRIKKADISKKTILTSINKVIKQNQNHHITDKQKEILDIIKEYQSQGRNVFTLFSHLFYDTPLDDSSPSFKNMCDWIEETVNFFNKNNDLLILKPHPAEVRPDEPQKEPTETLKSFLENRINKISDNVILLEPRLFSLGELYPYISCGLIWRSSVGMELTYLKIPCIIAAPPPYKTLDLIYAKSRSHYFELIKNANQLKISEEQVLDVARYIYVLEQKHVHIDSLYYDKKSRNMCWNKKAVQDYLKNGDINIDKLVDRMLD